MNFYEYYKIIFRRRLNIIEKEIQKTQWLPRDKLLELQLDKFKELIDYAYKFVPYYRNTWDKINLKPTQINSIDDIHKIPILTKDELMNNLHDLKSEKFYYNQLKQNFSGGTTGKMTIFYDCYNQDLYGAAFKNRQLSMAGFKRGERHAFLWGTQPKKRLRDFFLKELWLDGFNINNTKMKEYYFALKTFDAQLLSSYPSLTHLFAKFINENNLKLNFKSIDVTAEVLQKDYRKEIEVTFNSQLFNWYGSREIGDMAYECNNHIGMHINEEHAFLEVINEKNSQKGTGSLIATSLNKRGMPLIRFDTGDIVSLSNKNCSCGRGSRLITEIKGRKVDIIQGKNKLIHGEYFTHLFYGCKYIKQFQIIQSEKNKLKINIIKCKDYSEEKISNLIHEMEEFTGLKTQITIVDYIPLTSSGKRRFVISKLPSADI